MDIHRDYPCDPRNYAKGRSSDVKYIVVHYVGALGGAKANAKYYGSSKVGASAHYFVGHASEGAAVYTSVAEEDTAWHCGGGLQGKEGHTLHGICKNDNSIGVELCCHQDGDGRWYFDPETVDRGVELVRDIMARYHVPVARVVRHYDVTGKTCPAPYVLDDEAWKAFQRRLEGDSLDVQELLNSITEEQAYQLIQKAERYAAALPEPEWSREEGHWQSAGEAGFVDGTGPERYLKRDEFIAVLGRKGL